MIDPNEFAARLRKHFAEVTPEQFLENVKKYAPEILEGNAAEYTKAELEEANTAQFRFFQSQPTPLPLSAYFGCNLSGLEPEGRKSISKLSDIVARICSEHDIDLCTSHPVDNAEIPADTVCKLDREQILRSDLLIYLCQHPSNESPDALDFATDGLLPIILLAHSEMCQRRMVMGIPSFKLKIEYTNRDELKVQLKACLREIRPILEQRKAAFADYDVNIVGNHIRWLRQTLMLTREEVAQNAPHLTVETLRHIEESPDRVSNPSLIQLREIAAILKTTVADLVEPALNERLMATFTDLKERERKIYE
jgi:DNA-binding XRE family transcriptional regulator